MTPLNVFSVDVEDYFQVSAFEPYLARDQWPDQESRVVANTQVLLRLIERHQVHGTFFVLGWVAERFPQLVREIHQSGHELGSHSYWHRLVYEQSPDEFRSDLIRSRDVLQQITGAAVTAYRAPSFSITARSLWALEILAEEGFTADSSIFPIHHDRYGIPLAERRLHTIATPAGPLQEFPPAVVRCGRWNLPVSGGGYFRLYPWAWSRFCFRRINRGGAPFMFYVHPWEVDPQQPRLGLGSRAARFRHHVGLASTEGKLEQLLQTFRFGRLCDVLAHHAALPPTVSERAS